MIKKNIGEFYKRWFLLEKDGDVVLFGLSDPFTTISTPLNFQGFDNIGSLEIAVDGIMGNGWFEAHYDAQSRIGGPSVEPVAQAPTEWMPKRQYEVGDVVYFSGIEFTCIKAHKSNKRTPAQRKNIWESENSVGEWERGTEYMRGDVAVYRKDSYACLQNHLSENNLRPKQSPLFWQLGVGEDVLPNDEPVVTNWKRGLDYVVGQWCYINGAIYECLITHRSKSNNRPDAQPPEWRLVK